MLVTQQATNKGKFLTRMQLNLYNLLNQKSFTELRCFIHDKTGMETMEARAVPSKKKSRSSEDQESQDFIKVSYYIRPDQDDTLEEIKLAVRRATGERTDKSALIREAIDLLADKYNVK